MKLTPSQVLEQYDVKRSTLYRDKDNGKVTWEEDERGRSVLDAAEAGRVYKKKQNETSQKVPLEQGENPEISKEIALLRQKVEFLEEKVTDRDKQLEKKETEVEKLNARLDTAEREKAQLGMLLTDQRPKRSRWRFWEKEPTTNPTQATG